MDKTKLFEHDDLQKLYISLSFLLKDFPITIEAGNLTDGKECVLIYDNGSWYNAKGHGL